MTSKHNIFVTFLLLATVGCLAREANADDDTSDRKKAREALLEGMRMRATATRVVQLVDDRRVVGQASAEPVMRFSDEPRTILDASLWVFGTTGRPFALQKVEVYRRRDGATWFYCMTSLSEALIESKWVDGQSWSSKKPGTEFRSVPDAAQPAASEVARLFQMKAIARRFKATLHDDPVNKRVEMRLLARPLYRYPDADGFIEDGAIFGFATSGTNPDALLLVESHKSTSADREWKYGLARMTSGRVIVRLDDKKVWQVPYVRPAAPGRPSKFDNWLFFHEAVSDQSPDK